MAANLPFIKRVLMAGQDEISDALESAPKFPRTIRTKPVTGMVLNAD
jgi:hypothetical protein